MIEFDTNPDLIPELTRKVDAFNAKAARLGLDLVIVPTVEIETTSVESDVRGVFNTEEVAHVSFPDVEIRLPGDYTFVAVIEHLGEDGNLVRRSPMVDESIEVPTEYRTADPTCDHCGHVRMRNTTIVVVNADGEFKRVGSTCARNYLGISAAVLVTINSILDGFRDYAGRSGHSEPAVSAVMFLSVVSSVIKTYGWVSRGVAREYDKDASADIAWELMFGKREYVKRHYPEMFDVSGGPLFFTDEGDAEAEAALEWLTEEVDPEGNDYFWNLSVAVRSDMVTSRRAGIVGSLIAVYQREMGKRIEREAYDALPASTFFGDVKTRYEFDATMVHKGINEGYMYDTWDFFTIWRDAEGHTFWISTGTTSKMGHAIEDLDRGDTMEFKATVKAHKTTDKGEDITRLTRATPTNK